MMTYRQTDRQTDRISTCRLDSFKGSRKTKKTKPQKLRDALGETGDTGDTGDSGETGVLANSSRTKMGKDQYHLKLVFENVFKDFKN